MCGTIRAIASVARNLLSSVSRREGLHKPTFSKLFQLLPGRRVFGLYTCRTWYPFGLKAETVELHTIRSIPRRDRFHSSGGSRSRYTLIQTHPSKFFLLVTLQSLAACCETTLLKSRFWPRIVFFFFFCLSIGDFFFFSYFFFTIVCSLSYDFVLFCY